VYSTDMLESGMGQKPLELVLTQAAKSTCVHTSEI